MINLNAWFQKHGLCAENILYIYRKDRKTVIQRTDGAEFALFVPVHSVLYATIHLQNPSTKSFPSNLLDDNLSMSSKEQLFFKITHSTQNYSITL